MQIIGQWPMPNGNPAKTRNGKLVALAWKQPLQEKLDIDSEESDFHALNIICVLTQTSTMMTFVLILWMKKIHNTTIRNIYIYCYENFCSHTLAGVKKSWTTSLAQG
jgi:hypothetical protein